MHWLPRHLVAYLVAATSVLVLLTTGLLTKGLHTGAGGLTTSDCSEEDRYQSGSPADGDIGQLDDETAVLDAEESSPDVPERDAEEEPESKLFAMTELGRMSSTQRAMGSLLEITTRELGSGRSPQTLIFRPPRA